MSFSDLIIKPHPIPFEQWIASLPLGRQPRLNDFADRWDEWSPEVPAIMDGTRTIKAAIPPRKKEVGERRAYLAWIEGVMEPDEQALFGALSLRWDVLAQQALVPFIREQFRYITRMREYLDRDVYGAMKKLEEDVKELQSALTKVQQQLVEAERGD